MVLPDVLPHSAAPGVACLALGEGGREDVVENDREEPNSREDMPSVRPRDHVDTTRCEQGERRQSAVVVREESEPDRDRNDA